MLQKETVKCRRSNSSSISYVITDKDIEVIREKLLSKIISLYSGSSKLEQLGENLKIDQ